MRRGRAAILTAITVAAGIAVTCGGQIFDGYFDPQGNYHDKDGAVLFGPGTSCEGYDASALASTAGQWGNGYVTTSIVCDSGAACEEALPRNLAFYSGYDVHGSLLKVGCVTDAGDYVADGGLGVCAFGDTVPPACPGDNDEGNHYCQTFYQQFVGAPGAHALASCKPCREVHPQQYIACAGGYICVPDCCNDGFCVQRDGAAPRCEYPCQLHGGVH